MSDVAIPAIPYQATWGPPAITSRFIQKKKKKSKLQLQRISAVVKMFVKKIKKKSESTLVHVLVRHSSTLVRGWWLNSPRNVLLGGVTYKFKVVILILAAFH